jgi:hypothetical protein
MNEIFQANVAVIQARWPRLMAQLLNEDLTELQAGSDLVEGLDGTLRIHGVQLTSRHGRVREAQVQAAELPVASPVITVYGCGLGDLQQVLLQRKALRQLRVRILNLGVFALVLHLLDQTAWLADPRVDLQRAGDEHTFSRPFFALPAELTLADDFNARIRDLLVREIQREYVNQAFDPNDAFWRERVQSNLDLLREDADVAHLFGRYAGQEAFVFATGPTLERHFAKLRQVYAQARRPLFIAVDTALVPLLSQGIRPDLVVSIDAHISGKHLPVDDSAGMTLVYVPFLANELLRAWQGKRYAAYSASPLLAAARQSVDKAVLYSAGSVIHPAIDLAVRLGVAKVTLFGADFSYPGDKTHTGWEDGALGQGYAMARHWVLNGRGERVRTQLNFRSYLYGVTDYIAANPQVAFFNASQEGAMIHGAHFHPEFVA